MSGISPRALHEEAGFVLKENLSHGQIKPDQQITVVSVLFGQQQIGCLFEAGLDGVIKIHSCASN